MLERHDTDILILGSGPIVIGQACEFDYSGTQACKALREEGFRVILVNSNPATIMTDPEFSDRTYVEPLNLVSLTKIIEREKPDALLLVMFYNKSLKHADALLAAPPVLLLLFRTSIRLKQRFGLFNVILLCLLLGQRLG